MQYVLRCSPSSSVSSCSRMRLPSFSVKLRTQPTWSLRSPPSIRLSATTSCQRSWLLKSRSTAQTRSIGASITVERTTRCSTRLSRPSAGPRGRPRPLGGQRPNASAAASSPREVALEGVEAALEDAVADRLDERPLAPFVAIELGAPFGEAPRAVGHGSELQRRDVVLDAHRAFEDLVDALVVVVREREQTLADSTAFPGVEVADAADAVARLAVLDPTVGDSRVPLRHAVEVADPRPHGVGTRVDDARDVDPDHALALLTPGCASSAAALPDRRSRRRRGAGCRGLRCRSRAAAGRRAVPARGSAAPS